MKFLVPYNYVIVLSTVLPHHPAHTGAQCHQKKMQIATQPQAVIGSFWHGLLLCLTLLSNFLKNNIIWEKGRIQDF